jgi:hypothetical protein
LPSFCLDELQKPTSSDAAVELLAEAMNKSLPPSRVSSSRQTLSADEFVSDHVTPDIRADVTSAMEESNDDADESRLREIIEKGVMVYLRLQIHEGCMC